MRSESLARAFNPRAVAVIGASTDPLKFGYKIVEYLAKGGFSGAIYPINPRGEPVCGVQSYPVLGAVPGAVDLVAVTVPAAATADALRQCASRNVAVAVLIASGFAEASPEGARMQDELVQIARAAGMRLIGPNCEGLVDFHAGLLLSFSMMFLGLSPGPVSIVSQSGAYCGIVASRLSRAGVGPAKVVSSGNEADLAAVDYLEALVTDPDTRVIMLHVEGVRDPDRFARVLGEATARKPVVVNKTGRTPAGQRQAARHTGAGPSDDAFFDALVRDAGAVRTRHMDEFVDAALALATQPSLGGRCVAIVSVAGGLAVEMCDLLVEAGFTVPTLGDATQAVLRRYVPPFGTIANPVDLTGSMITQAGAVGRCLEAVLSDESVDAVALVLTAVGDPAFARVVCDVVGRSGKPGLVCWTAGRERAGDALDFLTERGVPVYDSTVRVVHALSALHVYWQRRRSASREARQA